MQNGMNNDKIHCRDKDVRGELYLQRRILEFV